MDKWPRHVKLGVLLFQGEQTLNQNYDNVTELKKNSRHEKF